MTLAPQVIEQGPRHRLIVLPSGEQIIQHPKEYTERFTTMTNPYNDVPPQVSKARDEAMIKKLIEDGTYEIGEVIDTYVTEWAENPRAYDDFIITWSCRAGVIFWPPIPEGH